MPRDSKRKAEADVRRAQSEFEHTGSQHDKARKARRESFLRAQKAGLSLRDIGEAVGLHRVRVGEIIRGK